MRELFRPAGRLTAMMMRGPALSLLVLVVAACSGGHHTRAAATSQQRADAACRAAAPHDFFNAQATTVGDIHAIPGPVKNITHAFSDVLRLLPSSDFAAWCWRQPTPHTYVSYVVGPSGEVVNVHTTWNGEPPPRPGPEIPT